MRRIWFDQTDTSPWPLLHRTLQKGSVDISRRGVFD
jgi:hypothetical protein